jgi:hypothetical protein
LVKKEIEYYKLEFKQIIQYSSNNDYVAEMFSLYSKSVKSRLKKQKNVDHLFLKPKAKKNPPTSPQKPVGALPPPGKKMRRIPFLKKEKKRKEKLVRGYCKLPKTDSSKNRWGHLPFRKEKKKEKWKNVAWT